MSDLYVILKRLTKFFFYLTYYSKENNFTKTVPLSNKKNFITKQ